MTRRTGRDRRVLGYSLRISDLATMLANMAPLHDYNAAIVTTSGANLSTVPNQGTAGGQLTVVAGTIAAPTQDSALQNGYSWTAPGGQTVQSSLAASNFRFLHDGTGAHTFCVYVPISAATAGIWATRAFTGTEVGTGVFYQANQSFNFACYNGSASEFVHAGGAASAPINVGYVVENAYKEGRTPSEATTYQGTTGTVLGASNTSNTPASGDAVGTLRIGDTVGGAVQGRGRYARWIGFNRVLSDYERDVVRTYLRRLYGV